MAITIFLLWLLGVLLIIAFVALVCIRYRKLQRDIEEKQRLPTHDALRNRPSITPTARNLTNANENEFKEDEFRTT